MRATRLVRSVAITAGLSVLAAGTAPADPVEPDFTPLPAPSLNFYGLPGLMDMPSAEMMPEGQFATTVASFAGQTRYTLAFQPTPWLMATFRYNGIRDLNLFGFDTYYDRNFDVRFRLFRERGIWPGVTLGLQDFAGTGINSGEYIVATKTFPTPALGRAGEAGRLKVSAGLGWGRLASQGAFGSFGTRPAFDINDTGGELSYDQWFRGPVAPFAGIEWQANDRLGFKLEYSSDAYVTETRDSAVFERDSSVNFGVEYQATPRTRLGAYYLYGDSFGLSAQIQLNPRHPPRRLSIPAPQPVALRPDRARQPQAWDTGWAASTEAVPGLRDRLDPLLKADGLVLESLSVSPDQAELRYRNTRYLSQSVAAGRAARALARVLPASVETFRLVPVARGMGLSAMVLRRSDLEALEFDALSSEAMLAVTGIGEAAARAPEEAVPGRDLYPDFSWSVAPYFSPTYFDPSQPLRMDVGVDLNANYKPAPGWVIAGTLRQRLAGNVESGRVSSSALPQVRTDQVLYAQYGTTLENLYAARYWRPGSDLFARVTGGYFESAYGGLSAELLWKPVNSLLGLGIEANYVAKRDYDQRLGFQDYRVLTGHASAYMDLGRGFHAQIDAGRYLAGDYGATIAIDRVFNNGWSVGGFFTMTNVSAEEFGEGSFDKGIRFSIPVQWFLGKSSQRMLGTTIRPIQRDGGARVFVPGRLYGQVRTAHRKALADGWPGFWE